MTLTSLGCTFCKTFLSVVFTNNLKYHVMDLMVSPASFLAKTYFFQGRFKKARGFCRFHIIVNMTSRNAIHQKKWSSLIQKPCFLKTHARATKLTCQTNQCQSKQIIKILNATKTNDFNWVSINLPHHPDRSEPINIPDKNNTF